eukprot:1755196-Rhodomonas_salina.1
MIAWDSGRMAPSCGHMARGTRSCCRTPAHWQWPGWARGGTKEEAGWTRTVGLGSGDQGELQVAASARDGSRWDSSGATPSQPETQAPERVALAGGALSTTVTA